MYILRVRVQKFLSDRAMLIEKQDYSSFTQLTVPVRLGMRNGEMNKVKATVEGGDAMMKIAALNGNTDTEC